MLLVDASKDAMLIMADMGEYTRLEQIQQVLEEEMQDIMEDGFPLIEEFDMNDEADGIDPAKKERFGEISKRTKGIRKGLEKHDKDVKGFAKIVFGKDSFGVTSAFKYMSQDLIDESSDTDDDIATLMNDPKVPDYIKDLLANLPDGAKFRHIGGGRVGINLGGVKKADRENVINELKAKAGPEAVDDVFNGMRDVLNEQILKFPFSMRLSMAVNFLVKPEVIRFKRWLNKRKENKGSNPSQPSAQEEKKG